MNPKLQQAFYAFDEYNMDDPETEIFGGKPLPKNLLYGKRMTEWLEKYEPSASEAIQLAARCQHIGRWEIIRKSYSMDKKGYMQWRHAEKIHQCKIADGILRSCGYDEITIEKVKFLLMKKELQFNADTKLLEDVICLVFIQYYLQEFSTKHDDAKVVDILQKTMRKMTPRAIQEVDKMHLDVTVKKLIIKAAEG